MFHYEEPIFKKKKLLRIEMLEQLRDYPRNYFKLHFQGFSNGIMDGCQITWDNGQLNIAPGILYFAGNIYFMENSCQMECHAENKMRYLKVEFMTEIQDEGKIEGNTRIILDDRIPDVACELELCRFRLQEGARLRDTYENFEDYATEYDTVNRIYVPFASYGHATIWPEILRRYAEEILEAGSKNLFDISFAMNVLANQGEVPKECIERYLQMSQERKKTESGNKSIYDGLREVLIQAKNGKSLRTHETGEQHSVILW